MHLNRQIRSIDSNRQTVVENFLQLLRRPLVSCGYTTISRRLSLQFLRNKTCRSFSGIHTDLLVNKASNAVNEKIVSHRNESLHISGEEFF